MEKASPRNIMVDRSAERAIGVSGGSGGCSHFGILTIPVVDCLVAFEGCVVAVAFTRGFCPGAGLEQSAHPSMFHHAFHSE